MNKEILKRYFEGRSSRWEKKQVQEYFEGDDLRVFDEYLRTEEVTAEEPVVADTYKDVFYNELTSRINEIENPGSVRRIRNLVPILKIAASILLVSGLGSIFYISKVRQNTTAISTDVTRISNNSRNLKMVTLQDGTRIWINPGTVLAYNSKDFNDTARQVSIIGEAYFNVAHNKAKPFRVKAGAITTTVLGTKFNVEAYANEPDVRVLLVTGSVRVNSATEVETLVPGQLLKYVYGKASMKITSIDVSDKQELFTSGKLVFENLPLKDVLKRLERVFNLQISTGDANLLTNKRISGAYYRDDPEATLSRILFIHGLHYNKKGENKYVITE